MNHLADVEDNLASIEKYQVDDLVIVLIIKEFFEILVQDLYYLSLSLVSGISSL